MSTHDTTGGAERLLESLKGRKPRNPEWREEIGIPHLSEEDHPIPNETTELEAARRIVEVAKRYRDWMSGGQITPNDKSELIAAVDAYEKVVDHGQ